MLKAFQGHSSIRTDHGSRDLGLACSQQPGWGLQVIRRPLHFAIVDEVDSILIDNCRNPMLISAPAIQTAGRLGVAFQVVQLIPQPAVTHACAFGAQPEGCIVDQGLESEASYLSIRPCECI